MEYHHLHRSREICPAAKCSQTITWQVTHGAYGIVELCQDHLVELLALEPPRPHYLASLAEDNVRSVLCGHEGPEFLVTLTEQPRPPVAAQLCKVCAKAVADALEDQFPYSSHMRQGVSNHDET